MVYPTMNSSKKLSPEQITATTNLKYSLEAIISNWLTLLLAWNSRNSSNNKLLPFEEKGVTQIAEYYGRQFNMESEDIALFCKKILLNKCQHLLTKTEYITFSKYIDNRTTKELWTFIEQKIHKQKEFEQLEKDPDFKAYTTTILLAQKMCNEFKITSLDHKNIPLLRSYIRKAKPTHLPEEQWVILDDQFFEWVKKQKTAKNPITFIDITHQETAWENPTHIKMWLYLLMSAKGENKNDTNFFSIQKNDITTFTLTDNWCKLFERIFDASCKLHRKLINDPQNDNYVYTIQSIEDIQDIFLNRYQHPWQATPSNLEKQNLDGFIDVAESLFHIWSHRLRGNTRRSQEDQFVTLIEQQRDFNEKESRKKIFNLTPFREEIVEKFKDIIWQFELTVDNQTGEKLTSEVFMSLIDKKTMKWAIPVKDKKGNKYIFSWRCKELESIVNKMLNTPKYSHIDAFNDILWTRFELIQPNTQENNEEEAITNLFTEYMDKAWTDKDLKFYSLKWIFHKKLKDTASKKRAGKEKPTPVQSDEHQWVFNNKTGNGYNEIKLVFKAFEVQMVQKGNNTTWSKDEHIYAFKKIEDVLWRVMNTISLDNVSMDSLKRWLRASLTAKRYDLIVQQLKAKKIRNIDSDIVYDMCTIQLVHELLKEEQQYQTNISNTILYILAKKHYIDNWTFTAHDFTAFEEKYTQELSIWTQDTTKKTSITSIAPEKLGETVVGTQLAAFFQMCDTPDFLYTVLLNFKEADKKQRETSFLQLNTGTLEQQLHDTVEVHSQERIKHEKEKTRAEIEKMFRTISWKPYTTQVHALTDDIEQWKAKGSVSNHIKRIFREALLDKKSWKNQDAHLMRKVGKKSLQYVGQWIVSVLQKVLKVSGTYQDVYPYLFELVERYYELHEIDIKKNYIETYTKGEQNFKQRTQSCAANYFEDMHLFIKKSGMYNEYRALINVYLNEYLKNQIAKNSEWAYMHDSGNLTVEKIKPAKIARLNKMYLVWQTPSKHTDTLEKEHTDNPEQI